LSRPDLYNLTSALLFLGFVGAGAFLTRPWRGDHAERRRRRISLFLVVALGASFPPGLLQRSLWPFASWHLIAKRLGPTLEYPRVMLVDSLGAEHNIDYRAWEPLIFMEIRHWVWWDLPRLPPAQQQEASRYLLALANEGRRRALAGERVGTRDRWLGRAAAPAFLLHPALWADPSNVPPLPFTGLRLYVEVWNLEDRARGDSSMQRLLLFDGGQAP